MTEDNHPNPLPRNRRKEIAKPEILAQANKGTRYGVDDYGIAIVTHVDSIRRTARITAGRHKEIIALLPEDHSDASLPPQGEGVKAWVFFGGREQPQIICYLPETTPYSADEVLETSPRTEGATRKIDETLFSIDVNYRSWKDWDSGLNMRGSKPRDLIPGDKVTRTVDGNFIGALRGGINVMKTSDLCQVIQSAVDNLTRTVSSNYQLYTDWGTIDISNDEDSVKLHLQCSDRHKEKSKKEIYDFSLELGETESGDFISIKYVTKDEKTYTYNMNKKGKIQINMPNDLITKVAQDKNSAVGGNCVEVIGKEKVVEYGSKAIIQPQPSASSTNGTLHLGGEATHPADTLVQQPHLDKYEELLKFVLKVMVTPMADIIPVPLIGKLSATDPSVGSDFGKLTAQVPTVQKDKTDIAVAK